MNRQEQRITEMNDAEMVMLQERLRVAKSQRSILRAEAKEHEALGDRLEAQRLADQANDEFKHMQRIKTEIAHRRSQLALRRTDVVDGITTRRPCHAYAADKGRAVGCRRNARPGYLTCWQHKGAEAAVKRGR